MYFTGSNFRLTPEVNQMKVSLGDLTVYGTGQSEFGLSGQGNILKFQFSGSKIISPSGKIVGTYNNGEAFNLDWILDTGIYQYRFNGDLIENRKSKPSFNIQKFFVNSTGSSVSADVKLYTVDIPCSISFPDRFLALSSLSGSLTNTSPFKFRVFDNSLNFFQTTSQLLSGKATGFATGTTSFPLLFTDANTSRFDSELQFGLTLQTAIGPIDGVFTTDRVSGLDTTVSKLVTDFGNTGLYVLFDGSGITGNKFVYINTPAQYLISYYAPSTNLRGEQKTKIINVKIESVLPTGVTGAYTSEYITGFTLVSGGEYVYPPSAKFSGYYYVSGLDTPLSRILLSSGCSGDLPVTFSGNSSRGVNASGVLKSTKVRLTGVYGEGNNNYYMPTSFQLVSGGTGYVFQPTAFIQTGVFSNCYDLGLKYGYNYSIYMPFTGLGVLAPQADYLTGEVLTNTGLVSGGLYTGYVVTGIRITNPGSGYNSTYLPKMHFVRQVGDTLGANATGNFNLKATGFYNFTGNWSLYTGLSSSDLVIMTGTSGIINLDSGSNYVTAKISFSGIDNTQPVVAKFTASMVGANTLEHLITGAKRYDISTGFLKKKNRLELITLPVGTDLTFSLTESDLDAFYSGPEYMNSGDSIDIGDLDF